jgi:chemotaxis protein histidine kinase CheA/ActR/RegA family two-component response regulator
MLSEQQQRILGYFIEEARDHLNTIEQGLLNLQATLNDSEMINEVFRAAHSIKGGSAMLGLSSIQRTAHRLEDCFKVLKENPIQVDQKLESLFLGVSDTLKVLLEHLSGPFGLSEEAANNLMSEAEPVFGWLNEHLELLLGQQTGANNIKISTIETSEPVVSSQNAPISQESWQNFQTQVLQQLREMLQQFKQAATPESRQKLTTCCQRLVTVGEELYLMNWCSLCLATENAIANQENTYLTLAKVVITEIKQALELALANRDAEITISSQLEALMSVPDIELLEIDDNLLSEPTDINRSEVDPRDTFNNAPSDAEADAISSLFDSADESLIEDSDSIDDLFELTEQIQDSSDLSSALNSKDDDQINNLFELTEQLQSNEQSNDEFLSIGYTQSSDNIDSLFEIFQQLDDLSKTPQPVDSKASDKIDNLFELTNQLENINDISFDETPDKTSTNNIFVLNGPEVGLAELTELDQLFGDNSPELEVNWQEEQIPESSTANHADAVSSQDEELFLINTDVEELLLFEDSTNIQERQLAATPKEELTIVQLFGGFLDETSEVNHQQVISNNTLDEFTTIDDLNLNEIPVATDEESDLDRLFLDGAEDNFDQEIDLIDFKHTQKESSISETVTLGYENLNGTAALEAKSSLSTPEDDFSDLFDSTQPIFSELSPIDDDFSSFWTVNKQDEEPKLTSTPQQDVPKALDDSLFATTSHPTELNNLDLDLEQHPFDLLFVEDAEDDLFDQLAEIENPPEVNSLSLSSMEQSSTLPTEVIIPVVELADSNTVASSIDDINPFNVENLVVPLGSTIQDTTENNIFAVELPDNSGADSSQDPFAVEIPDNSEAGSSQDSFAVEALHNFNDDLFGIHKSDIDEINVADSTSTSLLSESIVLSQVQSEDKSADSTLNSLVADDLFNESADSTLNSLVTEAEDDLFNESADSTLNSLVANDLFNESPDSALNSLVAEAEDDLFNESNFWFAETVVEPSNKELFLDFEDKSNNLEDLTIINENSEALIQEESLIFDADLGDLFSFNIDEFNDENLEESQNLELSPIVQIDTQINLSQIVEENVSNIDEFDELEALLGEETTAESIVFDDFAELEALLLADTAINSLPAVATAINQNVAKASASVEIADEFSDLEKLLGDADSGMSATGSGINMAKIQRQIPRRTARFEQLMKVPVKHLDDLSNLVGELVVNRNTLEQDHERMRQSLDNLLQQVHQLSDVGARMQELYERSLLESSLLATRKNGITFGGTNNNNNNSSALVESDRGFNELEMDRFTPFHTLSQEMIELIVRVRESASDIDFVTEETERVARQFRQVTTQIQEGLTRTRMVPFSQVADRVRRGVRDNAIKCGKQVDLMIEGQDTLIDKVILEHLTDPLVHMLNNAIAHGIETPEERQSKGKQGTGVITVRAFHQGNQTVLAVGDDGAGIDPEMVKEKAIRVGLITPEDALFMSRTEVYDLLFEPNFSTKDQADDLAGRGVGMDVVRTSINEIRGVINTDSHIGKGTTFTIRLPLTLSICKALCCICDRSKIAFPMDGVEDTLDISPKSVQQNAEGDSYIMWRDIQLPFKPLKDLLTLNRQLSRGNVYGGNRDDDMISVVVIRSANTLIGLQVDLVLSEQEIVIKQFEGPAPKPVGVAGATVLGDGRIMAIADVLEIIDLFQGRTSKQSIITWEPASTETVVAKVDPTVLIVDDSITVRELLSLTFNKAGYRVEQARDGQEAWEKLRSGLPCDIVFCDIEMPRCDGLELLSRIQKESSLTHLPIAMLTSRGADKHKQMAINLGASGYFTKPYLEEALLEAAGRMLKGEKLLGNANPG